MGKSAAVVFWTGTGNTEAMAGAVGEGVREAGGTARVVPVSEFPAQEVTSYDALAFGCPAMGAEELEADEFEPVWEACGGELGGRPVALFGSYGWGSGEWMDSWREAAESEGVNVVATVIANEAPDDEAVAACRGVARALVDA